MTKWRLVSRSSDFMFNTLYSQRIWFLHLSTVAAAAAKSLQSCPTLCDPIDGSPPGSPVPGILQARTLEWVAISFSTVSRVIINDDYELLLDPVVSCGESSQNWIVFNIVWYWVIFSILFCFIIPSKLTNCRTLKSWSVYALCTLLHQMCSVFLYVFTIIFCMC